MKRGWQRSAIALLIGLTIGLTGCGMTQVSAESRLLLPLSVEFLGIYILPQQVVDNTPVGGLSALSYDRRADRFLALSDDRSSFAPARFYTLKVDWRQAPAPEGGNTVTGIEQVTVEQVTLLKDEAGQPFRDGTIDPEGLAITPRNTVLIASEGDVREGVAPFIREFDRATGRAVRQPLPLPTRYLPGQTADGQTQGIRDNLGFESLSIAPVGSNPSPVEPFRAFTAVESNLAQDLERSGAPPSSPAEADRDATGNRNSDAIDDPQSRDPGRNPPSAQDSDNQPRSIPPRSRILHFSLGDGPPFPISEHLYELDPAPFGTISNGLVEFTALDPGGHFLSLERTFGPLQGFGVKLFQVELGTATDTASYESLRGSLADVAPARKQLLLNLNDLGLAIDNVEGLALGPRLPDGRQSLLLISDDNFRQKQATQLILLALNGFQPK
jgi:hypothetical protein